MQKYIAEKQTFFIGFSPPAFERLTQRLSACRTFAIFPVGMRAPSRLVDRSRSSTENQNCFPSESRSRQSELKSVKKAPYTRPGCTLTQPSETTSSRTYLRANSPAGHETRSQARIHRRRCERAYTGVHARTHARTHTGCVSTRLPARGCARLHCGARHAPYKRPLADARSTRWPWVNVAYLPAGAVPACVPIFLTGLCTTFTVHSRTPVAGVK